MSPFLIQGTLMDKLALEPATPRNFHANYQCIHTGEYWEVL